MEYQWTTSVQPTILVDDYDRSADHRYSPSTIIIHENGITDSQIRDLWFLIYDRLIYGSQFKLKWCPGALESSDYPEREQV